MRQNEFGQMDPCSRRSSAARAVYARNLKTLLTLSEARKCLERGNIGIFRGERAGLVPSRCDSRSGFSEKRVEPLLRRLISGRECLILARALILIDKRQGEYAGLDI
jgi:hypothetical protein